MTSPPNDPHRPDDAVPPAGAVGGGADGGPDASGGGTGGVTQPGGGLDGGPDASGGGSGGVAEPGGATREGGPVAAHGAVDGVHVGAHRAPPGAPNRSRTMWLLIGAGVVALAVIVGLFFVGLRVGGGDEAAPVSTATNATGGGDASGTATAGPTSTSTPPPTTPTPPVDAAPAPGPLPPGVHDWNALHGGECLTGYTSPWELQFTVVDCAGDHNAQLVSKGAFAEDAAAPFPGEAELISRLNLLCTAPSVLDYAAAATVPDIQWQGAYPANDAQWAGGDRAYFCFFSRTSGEPLGASLAAPPAG